MKRKKLLQPMSRLLYLIKMYNYSQRSLPCGSYPSGYSSLFRDFQGAQGSSLSRDSQGSPAGENFVRAVREPPLRIKGPAASEKKRGYTLIESLIALAVLMTVVLPLVGFLYKYNSGVQAQRSFSAMCLLEQEAALAAVFPEDVVPAKRRIIDGREYVVTTGASGNGPLVYRMAATTNKREAASVVFYGRKADASVR